MAMLVGLTCRQDTAPLGVFGTAAAAAALESALHSVAYNGLGPALPQPRLGLQAVTLLFANLVDCSAQTSHRARVGQCRRSHGRSSLKNRIGLKPCFSNFANLS